MPENDGKQGKEQGGGNGGDGAGERIGLMEAAIHWTGDEGRKAGREAKFIIIIRIY